MKQSTTSPDQIKDSISLTREHPRMLPKLLPYTPPDALMFQLFSAIQRRAWTQARTLCYELILCDPWRKNYRDLYERLNQIIKINNERRRPRQTATSSNNSGRRTTSRR